MTPLFDALVGQAKYHAENNRSCRSPRLAGTAVIRQLNIIQVIGVICELADASHPVPDLAFIDDVVGIDSFLRELLISAMADQMLQDPAIRAEFLHRQEKAPTSA